MPDPSSQDPKRPTAEFGLPAMAAEPSSGLALDQLSAALTGMLGEGDDPYTSLPSGDDADDAVLAASESSDDACEISPRSILEAMLFVGGAQQEGLTAGQVAALMRGVRAAEVDALVRDLNASYRRRNCPYTIVARGGGYHMALRPEFHRLRDKFFGRTRQARLSQAAIEVLAAVAYHEPVTSDDVAELRGTASGAVLAQLVRRQLLRIERSETKPRRATYYTTPRFLELFGLSSLADLPRSHELEPG